MVTGGCQKSRNLFVPALPRPVNVNSFVLREEAAYERQWMAIERPIPTMKICLNPKGLSAEGTGGAGILAAVLIVLAVVFAFGLWLIFRH